MKKYIFYFALILSCVEVSAQKLPATGLIFSKEDTTVFPRKTELLAKATYDNLPITYSMESFSPSISNQREFPTCVAFSTAYYMRTILEAIEQKLTNKTSIDATAFSPAYLHEKIKKTNVNDCSTGTTLPDALLALKDFGVPLLSEAPYPNCGFSTSILDASAANHKIREIVVIPFPKKGTPIQRANGIKKALTENTPVVFGMNVPQSFLLNTQNIWTPTPTELMGGSTLYGHAMCIIGYDDKIGAFKIINSWGTQWGNNGFCWIRYADFFRFTPSPVAFQVYAMPAQRQLATMQANIEFKLRSGEPMPVSYKQVSFKGQITTDDENKPITNPEIVHYTMKNDYQSGTSYKLYVNNTQKSYIYVIGTDQTMKMSALFPYASNVSTYIGGNSTMVFPSESKSITLDNNVGMEYTLILFSKEPLNYDKIVSKLQSANGGFTERVVKVLGNELIESKYIKYTPNSAGFEVNTKTESSIVPILVSFKHF